MELLIKRKEFTDQSTIGELYINGQFDCYTLEDRDRKIEAGGTKVDSQTAIPRGRYEIVITFSNRFQQYMPLLLRVPLFEGIRIHTGNTKDNTEGCILVGATKGENTISNSRFAYRNLFDKLKKAEKKEKIYITIQ